MAYHIYASDRGCCLAHDFADEAGKSDLCRIRGVADPNPITKRYSFAHGAIIGDVDSRASLEEVADLLPEVVAGKRGPYIKRRKLISD